MSQGIVGLRVLVTRPEEAGEALARALLGRGASPWFVPAIRILIDPNDPALARARAELERSDRLLLSSRYGLVALLAMGAQVAKTAKVWAVGAQTAKMCQASGFEVACAAEAGGLAELAKDILRVDPTPNLRVLWASGDLSEDTAVEPLRSAGHTITSIPVYKNVNAFIGKGAPPVERLLEMDAALFASPSAVKNLCAAVPPEALDRFRARWRVVVIGETTRRAAADSGFKRIAVAPEPSNEGLLAALETSARN